MRINRQKGFTIMEMLVYIGLFAIIIGGGITGAYSLMSNNTELVDQAIIETEALFMLRKMDWALTGATNVLEPEVDSSDDRVLAVTKDGRPHFFRVDDGKMTLEVGNEGEIDISTINVLVGSSTFHHIGGNPPTVSLSFWVNDKEFTYVKQIR